MFQAGTCFKLETKPERNARACFDWRRWVIPENFVVLVQILVLWAQLLSLPSAWLTRTTGSSKPSLQTIIYSHYEHRPASYLVCCVLGTGVLNLHQHVGMQEVGGDHVRNKRRGLFLEDCSHDVVSYVPLPLELERQRGRRCISRSTRFHFVAVSLRRHIWKQQRNLRVFRDT